MNLPPGIFHESFCAALARYHAFIGVRAANAADKDFHGRRADAFADCATLPPSQMRLTMFLSDRFQNFGFVRGRLFVALHKRPPASKPAGVLIV
jgi:hypothetical protein